MHIAWNARRLVAFVALALVSSAFAQPQVYENPALGFQIAIPAGWAASEEMSPDGMLLLQFAAPSGQGAIGVVAAPITEAERAYWSGPREDLVRDVWEGFLPEVPGAQITQTYEIVVAGAQGSVIDYASPNVAGTMVIVVSNVASFTFFSVADQESLAAAQGGLQALVGSFGFLGGGAPAGPIGGVGAPGAPGGGAPPPANPVGGSAPSNPLGGGAPPAPSGDPHVGSFADGRLQLTLTAAPDGYAGEVVFDGARYPVIALARDGGISGQFLAGGTPYGFEAQLAGDTMTFVTDDARYALQRVR